MAINVANETELRSAIDIARTTADTTIVLTADITLTADLPALQGLGTIITSSTGNTFVIDGASSYRGLFVYAGDVTIQGIVIQNTLAAGGAGGASTGPGGGGAGFGGGLFVAAGATATMQM
jgi:hypothetical protein